MFALSPPKKKLKKLQKIIDFYLNFCYNYVRGGGEPLIKKIPFRSSNDTPGSVVRVGMLPKKIFKKL